MLLSSLSLILLPRCTVLALYHITRSCFESKILLRDIFEFVLESVYALGHCFIVVFDSDLINSLAFILPCEFCYIFSRF